MLRNPADLEHLETVVDDIHDTDLPAVKVDTAAILVDTADMQPKLGTPAADISADIAAVKVDTGNIDGRLGSEYANAGGLPESDNVRAHLFRVGGFGGGWAHKDLNLVSTAAVATIFTVTGEVIVRIVAYVGSAFSSAAGANVAVGIASDPDAILPSTLATDLDQGDIWHDNSPDSDIEALSTIRAYIIVEGADIIITPDAVVDWGICEFYAFWTPISPDGNVVAA